jgi:hypothetical protein
MASGARHPKFFRTLKPMTMESRRVHAHGSFAPWDVHLAHEACERVQWMAMAAAEEPKPVEAFARLAAYGFAGS